MTFSLVGWLRRVVCVLGVALLACTACARESAPAEQPASRPEASVRPGAAGDDPALWPEDTGSVDWPVIAIGVTETTLRKAADVAAAEAGFVLENPERLPAEKRISLHFKQVSSRSIFYIIADEANMHATRIGDRIRFDPGPAPVD